MLHINIYVYLCDMKLKQRLKFQMFFDVRNYKNG